MRIILREREGGERGGRERGSNLKEKRGKERVRRRRKGYTHNNENTNMI